MPAPDAGPLITVDGFTGTGDLPAHRVMIWTPEPDDPHADWRARIVVDGPVYRLDTQVRGLDPLQALEQACAFARNLMAPRQSAGPS